MARRRYGQYCGVARALDVLGERWTLLIVRDLLAGPLRYSDLSAGLAGISTDMLAERLRTLQEVGAVEQVRLPAPAASVVYQLTDFGERLRPIVHGLGDWGAQLLEAPGETEDRIEPGWALETLTAGYSGPPDLAVTARLDFDGRIFTVEVERGTARLRRGASNRPDLALAGPTRLLLGVLTGAISLESSRSRLAVEGDTERLERVLKGLPTFPPAV